MKENGNIIRNCDMPFMQYEQNIEYPFLRACFMAAKCNSWDVLKTLVSIYAWNTIITHPEYQAISKTS